MPLEIQWPGIDVQGTETSEQILSYGDKLKTDAQEWYISDWLKNKISQMIDSATAEDQLSNSGSRSWTLANMQQLESLLWPTWYSKVKKAYYQEQALSWVWDLGELVNSLQTVADKVYGDKYRGNTPKLKISWLSTKDEEDFDTALDEAYGSPIDDNPVNPPVTEDPQPKI